MDAKITLSFSESVATKAKKYAERNNISLSRLVEHLLDKVTSSGYASFEDFPVADWVNQVAEGETVYKKRTSRKALKNEYYTSKK